MSVVVIPRPSLPKETTNESSRLVGNLVVADAGGVVAGTNDGVGGCGGPLPCRLSALLSPLSCRTLAYASQALIVVVVAAGCYSGGGRGASLDERPP